MTVVALVGAATALFAATIGCLQNDIKKVLAYSTVSQLGYMFIGVGVGTFWAGSYHLLTHAFFKACLFLGAGSVILAMHHEQDMRKMGGLRHRMPVTYWTSLIGALALIGTPFFSGFYSKDALIEAVAESHRAGAGYAYVCVLLGVFITALYTFRMIFMTFHGKERLDHHAQDHFHDVGWDMKAPLVALAIPSVFIGFFTIQPVLFGNYFGSAIQVAEHNDVVAEIGHHFQGPVAFALHGPLGAPFWLALSGVVCAWLFFLRHPSWAAAVQSRLSGLHSLLVNKYYFDWFNENVLARASRGLGNVLWKAGDQAVIDGTLVNGSAAAVNWFAGVARRVQTGYLYSYALWMVVGLAVLLGWFLIKAH